jgi:hypothetical protein
MGRPVVDITGFRFGKLTVLELSSRRTNDGKPFWYVGCDCGTVKEVTGSNLKNGLVKSCGCERAARSGADGIFYGNAFKNLTGKSFGRWTVLGRARTNRPIKWVCECTCGTIRTVVGNNLRRGMTLSCGCYHKEKASEAAFKHGKIDHPLYVVWSSMKERCYNPANKAWRWYGGKGIQVHQDWKDNFQNFYNDMAPTWKPGLWLDRVDSSKEYGPQNCRWVTPRDQWKEAFRSRRGYEYVEPVTEIDYDLFSEGD